MQAVGAQTSCFAYLFSNTVICGMSTIPSVFLIDYTRFNVVLVTRGDLGR